MPPPIDAPAIRESIDGCHPADSRKRREGRSSLNRLLDGEFAVVVATARLARERLLRPAPFQDEWLLLATTNCQCGRPVQVFPSGFRLAVTVVECLHLPALHAFDVN